MVKYSEIAVCAHIPKSWLAGTVCPVCGDTQLSIDPQADQADQMVCACCTSAFEVAVDGLHVHLVKLPSILPEKVKEIWYRPGELRELAAQSRLARQEQKLASIPAEILDADELRWRALGLRKLGNPPERIQTILLAMQGARKEDVQLVMQDLRVEQDKRERSVLRRVTICMASLILVVGLVAFFASQRVVLAEVFSNSGDGKNPIQKLVSIFQPKTQNEANQAAASSQSSGADEDSQFLDTALLPPVLQTAIPNGLKVLKPPKVVIIPGQPIGRSVRCPTSVGDAVRLFGGEMKIWTKSRGGWTMVSTSMQTITIPEGMTAGYLVYVSKPDFYSVSGPVTIQNLNFLAISCE